MMAAIIMVASLSTASAQSTQRDNDDFELAKSIEILANMMREIDTQFVDEVSAAKILENASMGMLIATDPYLEYLSEDDMNAFEVMTTGKYGGVGSLIRKKGDYIIFAQPYEGSPADEAGIKIGDKILAIDNQPMKGKGVEVISSNLKGDPGSDVSVVIERNLDGKQDTLTIRRRRIAIPSVPYSGIIRDGVGYINHNDFIDGSYDEVRRSLEAMLAEGELKGLVLDYRSNGGGVMQEAVDIASLFVPRGERIVSVMGRDSSSLSHYTTKHQPLAENIPIVVLVNGSSASASEILAGALQDLDRAVIMGGRTYGKGLVQSTLHVGYNSYLKITTAKYYIPSGRCVQARDYSSLSEDGSIGIVPDSLISEFTTRGGRKVYDGGGIVPDVKHDEEYVSRFAVMLYSLGYIEDWADIYMRSHQNMDIDVRTFTISDDDYADFCRFIEDKDVPYESETREALTTLRAAAEKERYDASLEGVLQGLDEMIKDDKMSNMQTYRTEITKILNQQLLLRYAYQAGAIEGVMVKDEMVNSAIDLILDSAEYERILREQNLPMH
jgi:carboxyl-terminal processing protease